MARRRLLPFLVAVAALLAPGSALADAGFRPAEIRDTQLPAFVAPDVATDADGNSVAVWLANGEARAAYRPHGGPWGPAESLDPGTTPQQVQPRVTVQPDGQFVAAWLLQNTGSGFLLRWARRPAGAGWSGANTITTVTCCPELAALEAGGDGSVTVMPLDEGVGSTNRKEPGSDTWGTDEDLPFTRQSPRLAVGSDGSAVAVVDSFCTVGELSVACMVGAYRPPGGPWGSEEQIALAQPGTAITGFDVAAAGTRYSVVWGETANSAGLTPPGAVRGADRGAGPGGEWSGAQDIADLPADMPYCGGANCFDLAVGVDGTQLALWTQQGQSGNLVAGALRDAFGADWGGADTVGTADGTSTVPHGAVPASGFPVAAWGSPFTTSVARGSHFEGGAWRTVELGTAPERGGPPPDAVYLGDLAADGQGDAVTAWKDGSGVLSAGFDATGPRFTAFSLPAGGSVTFSAAARDNWSGVAAISWLFGDGNGATGATVAHAYSSVGVFTATATAADGAGNTTEQSGPVTVTQTMPGPPGNQCGTVDTDKDSIPDGCDDSNGAERPRPFKTVNATVISGEVFVKLPPGSNASAAQAKPPKGFVRLTGAQTIPVGATLDTKRGRVKIRSAATTGRKLQTGQFFLGRFVIRQARIKRRSKKLITDMRLTGSSFKKACGARASISAKRKRSKKRVRRLFGDAKGSFRTSGRNAAATVRGTRWGVQDRCDGTLVTVQRGRVAVRDKVKRRTVVVRTRYLARVR